MREPRDSGEITAKCLQHNRKRGGIFYPLIITDRDNYTC